MAAFWIGGRCESYGSSMLKLTITFLPNYNIKIRYRITMIWNLKEHIFFVLLTINEIRPVTNLLLLIFSWLGDCSFRIWDIVSITNLCLTIKLSVIDQSPFGGRVKYWRHDTEFWPYLYFTLVFMVFLSLQMYFQSRCRHQRTEDGWYDLFFHSFKVIKLYILNFFWFKITNDE